MYERLGVQRIFLLKIRRQIFYSYMKLKSLGFLF